MNKFIIFFLPVFLTGCEKALTEITNIFSGKITDAYIENSGNGKNKDKIKKSYLNTIEKGLIDLKQMNDPNIMEVYSLVDKLLADNDLSMYDYNSIMGMINHHKTDINSKNSKHENDVADFKTRINQ